MREELARLQRAALAVGAVAAICGLLRSVDAFPLARWPAAWQLPLHLLVFTLGILAALAARRRIAWLEARRWEYATQAGASAEERKLAHEETERGRRAAARSFGAAPLGLGYWFVYQVEPGSHPLIAWLLPLTAMAGFAVGFAIGARSEERGANGE